MTEEFQKEVALENEKKKSEAQKTFQGNQHVDFTPIGVDSKIDGRKDTWTDSQIAKKAGVGVGSVARYNRVMNSDDEVLLDLLESNIRRRGEIGGSAKKVGKRIKELERLYGIREGSAGGNGSNQYIKKELEPNSSVEAKKSQSDLAAQMGISVDETMKKSL